MNAEGSEGSKGVGRHAGYPMAAIVGRPEVMDAAQRSFISSTFWTDRIGPAAAIATIRKCLHHDVERHLTDTGIRVQKGWQSAADAAGLAIHVGGIPALSHFGIDGKEANVARTYFTQIMLESGFLAGTGFYPMLAHTPAICPPQSEDQD